MEYLDDKLVDGLRVQVMASMAEAIEFAVSYQENQGEHDQDVLRQAAQDALAEMMPGLLDAAVEAYKRSVLTTPDYEAIAVLFKRLAIRSKLMELSRGHPIVVVTRKETYEGQFLDLLMHDGEDRLTLACMDDGHWEPVSIPVLSIQELEA